MFGIVLSAINAALGPLLKALFIKAIVFGVLVLITNAIVGEMTRRYLPAGDGGLSGAFSGLPAALAYFFGLFKFNVGLPMLISAQSTAFIIRRLPVIG
jgi:hypothetical protein